MSSGTLPLRTYHRAQSLGEGTYGSVVCVYDDAGDELALKVFEADEDHGTLELGTFREVSILRILRGANAHPNIVRMVDVREAGGEEGDCGDGNLCMAMPLYRMGDLKRAVERGILLPGLVGRRQRVDVAHGLLCAVAFLHDNHIIHRDIKSDNVMITMSEEDGDRLAPVLIDFSLAKFVAGQNAILPPGATHTGSVGTPTYTAPEVVARKAYGLPSDLWSVGVVLLETMIGELTVDRDKAAARLIEEKKAALPDSPFATLVRGLLETDPKKRLTAREALALSVFEKFGLEVPPVRIVDVKMALSNGDDDEDDADNKVKENALKPVNGNKKRQSIKQPKLSPRERLIKKLCGEIECKNPKTEAAAAAYAKEMEQLDDELDDISGTQTLLDCVVVASRFYEEELICLEELEEDDGEHYPSFRDFDIETFRDNETALLSLMDYSLYLRN
ncbi:hypothetical protein ACHAWF_005104 [Thalassiosira exigua]